MSRDLRTLMLTKVISMEGVFQHKYSTAYNILSSIIKLEEQELGKDKLPKKFFERYVKLSENICNLDKRIEGFPLLIIEQYFLRNSSRLDKHIYLAYGEDLESPSELKVSDLYEILERFFYQVYLLCVEIADYYSLEIKLKTTKQNEESADSMF